MAQAVPFQVSLAGTGEGAVTGGPPGDPAAINCSNVQGAEATDCTGDFSGTVTLTATPGPDATFGRWQGSVLIGNMGTCASGQANPCTTGLFLQGPATVTAFFLGAVVDPEVEFADVPDNIVLGDFVDGAFSADLRGFVNPTGGGLTACEFQWVPDGAPGGFGGAQTKGASCNPDLTDPDEADSNATDPVEVTATATGLEPNRTYLFRLLAEKDGIEPVTDQATFVTDPVAPDVVNVAAVPGATMATFQGRVHPHNSSTTWSLEYRLATSPAWVQVASGQADGNEPVGIVARALGLTPTSAYEFRLTAESEAGEGDSGIQTFSTAAAPLPRAHELVSPLPTAGIDVDIGTTGVHFGKGVSETGNAALFSTLFFPLPGSDEELIEQYLARRGDDGWTTKPAGVDAHHIGTSASSGSVGISADGSRALVRTTLGIDPDDQNHDGTTFNHGQDLYLRDADGDLTWISRSRHAATPPGTPQTDPAAIRVADSPVPAGMSADGSVVVFGSERNLLDSDPNPSTTGSNAPQSRRLYKWVDDGSEHGALELISVLPGASDPPTPADAPTGPTVNLGRSTFEWHPNAVSRDGSRIFWRHGGTIYAHVEGEEETIEVADGTYEGATPDGSRLFYTSAGRIFAYDVDARLAGTPDPSRDLTGPASVRGVAAISDSGTHVYFVADSEIPEAEPAPDGSLPSPVGRNLYLVEIPEGGEPVRIRFVAGPLHPEDSARIWGEPVGSGGAADWGFREAHTSPDGSVLAFASEGALIPGQPTAGFPQTYVYDDDGGTLVCASCPPNGAQPTGRVNASDGRPTALPSKRNFSRNGWARVRWVATDGTAFFNTPTPLLPRDTNQVNDVYAYGRGELVLLSAGTGDAPSNFYDASADGSTVFIRTRDALVPWDDEPGVMKLYAVRVGGGFPAPPTPQPPCAGEACQGSLAPSPGFEPPPSSGTPAPANPPQAEVSAAALTRQQARRLARGKRVALRVEVSGPGRVIFVARGRTGRGTAIAQLGRAAARARGAGELRVGLRLNHRGLRALRRQGRLEVRIVARFRGESAGQRVRLVDPRRLRLRAKRLRNRAAHQARRGNDVQAQSLRQRARRLGRRAQRLGREATVDDDRNQR